MMPKPDFCSMWQWLSMPPGRTNLPPASISRVAVPLTPGSTAAIRPSFTAMSPSIWRSSVTTLALRTMSS
jgi:hypothetical protein